MKERTTFEHEIATLLPAPTRLRELKPWDPAEEINQALKAKHWGKALDLAIEAGQRDETTLTNLIFFEQNPSLPRAPLDKKAKDFAKLSAQWTRIQKTEVTPAFQRAATDYELEVKGDLVAERDPDFAGKQGKEFRETVAWAAARAEINPGFLAAVLLAEVGGRRPYLQSGEVSSFFTGTDDFLAQAERMKKFVPAFKDIRFDPKKRITNINETGRKVTSILFKSGKDAALATAVYLKYAQHKLRQGAAANGGDFDAFPEQVRFALTRIAMAAGHGGIEMDGTFSWFKTVGDKSKQVKAGTKGAHLVGVAKWLSRVLKGEDIFVRGWGGRKFPDTAKIISRNATILTAQALHLSDWFFDIKLVSKPKRPVKPW